MSIPSSLGDLEAMEREMFDEYNGEGPKYKSDEEFYGALLDNEFGEDLPEESVDNKNESEGQIPYFLVQRMIDGEIIASIMSPARLIDYINMDDCHNESYEIFDCTSEFGKIKPLHYKGWQPGCLIEIIDETGKVVLSGQGEDH